MEIAIIAIIVLTTGLFFYSKYNYNKKLKDPLYVYLSREAELFLSGVEIYKTAYFTNSTKETFLEKYKDVYSKLNSNKSFLSLDKGTFKNFIKTYSTLDKLVKTWNKEYIRKELEENKEFLSNIDGKSLDEQQRMAVVVDEDSNLVIAGAGSGKTLTIAGKVKYLVEKKDINPDDILLISFTKKAAEEMQDRITHRLKINVDAKTFHGLGLDIITKNKAYRPDVFEGISKVIDNYFRNIIIKDKELIYSVLTYFGYYFNIPKDLGEFENAGESHEHYKNMDLETLKFKVRKKEQELKNEKETLKGENVRSLEEVMIANFLYLNGIEYEYEKLYPFESNDPYRKQYRPDFYLPEYDIYLEHFGVTRNFTTPWLTNIESKKYIDGIHWKRDFHKQNGTTLLETYSYFNSEGVLLYELAKMLKDHGVKSRPVNYRKIYEIIFKDENDKYFKEFKKLIITFLGLFKSRGYSSENFKELYEESKEIKNPFLKQRTKIFISIVKPIYENYESVLVESKQIDFNDMINMATEIVKSGSANLKYKYIIIDEYQDISMSRFNLIKSIQNETRAKIIAVGDDWQSIYRFTGSDISLFTQFKSYFQYTDVLKIEKTYRNSQELIDIAGKFVMKNPKQLKKELVSDKRHSNSIRILGYRENFTEAFEKSIEEIVYLSGDESEIMILGRNNFDIEMFRPINTIKDKTNRKIFQPMETDIMKVEKKDGQIKVTFKKYPKLNIYFLTVHKSKGLESENVIVINLRNELLGFPNKISDDPILSLVTTDLDDLDFAEERRLFYVALTRTKNSTYLISPDINKSVFVEELIKKQNINYDFVTHEQSIKDNPSCPRCQTGSLILREGSSDSSKFLGCSNYPSCDNTFKQVEILNNQIKCTRCEGYMVRRKGKNGEFYGCTNYPYCKNNINIKNDYDEGVYQETSNNDSLINVEEPNIHMQDELRIDRIQYQRNNADKENVKVLSEHGDSIKVTSINNINHLDDNDTNLYEKPIIIDVDANKTNIYRYKVWSKEGHGHLLEFIDFRVEVGAKQIDHKIRQNKIEWINYETENFIDEEIFEKYKLEYELID